MSDVVGREYVRDGHYPLTTGNTGINDKLELYLGPKAGNVEPSAYDKISSTNYDLPEYYKGKNLFLRDSIDGFIMDSNRWYTTVCLPWAYTDQAHITFNEWHFNMVMAGRVPHEGVSRLVTSSKSAFSDHVVRKGLAFIMEGDFYDTPEGDVHYQRNIMGITQSVQETSDYDTIWALLSCKDNKMQWQEKYGRMLISIDKIIDEEVTNYCAVSLEEGRFDIIVEATKGMMRRQKVEPTMILMSPGSTLYLVMVEPRATAFWGLQNGNLEYKEGPDSFGKLRGLDVFETREFEQEGALTIDLLTRRSQIGERYEMVFRRFRFNDIDYYSKFRDIYLYNQNKDDFDKITFKHAVEMSNLWGEDGNPHPKIKTEVDRLNGNSYQRGKRSNNKRSREPDVDEKPFFLITKGDDNLKQLVEYFGQMDAHTVLAADFEQVGKTIISKVYENPSKQVREWDNMVKLINDIENQAYDREYWRRLIEKNIQYSVDDKGLWEGENTPLLDKHVESVQLAEWAPNTYGSLVLPSCPEGVLFPSGFANAPGFETMAAEVNNPRTTWKNVAERASRALSMLNELVNVLKIVCPNSEAINPDGRSPWFHKPSYLTTFFETIVSIKRDPVFLAALPLKKDGEDVDGNVPGKMDNIDSIRWNPSPLFVVPEVHTESEALKEYIKELGEGRLSGKDVGELDSFAYTIPGGPSIEFPASLVTSGFMVSREIEAFRTMGVYSFQALFGILTRLRADKTGTYSGDAKKLISIVLNAVARTSPDAVATIRQIVRGLGQSDDLQTLHENISTLYITEASKSNARKKAQTLIKDLSKPFKNLPDENIQGISEKLGDPSEVRKYNNIDLETTGFSTTEISDRMDKITDIVTTLTPIRERAGLFGHFSVSNGSAWFTDTINDIPDNQKESYRAEMTRLQKLTADLLKMVKDKLSEGDMKGNKDTGVEKYVKYVSKSSGSAPKITVLDSPDAVLQSKFYRSPLTMSVTLLETLSNSEQPLIRPGDPRIGNLGFYDPGYDNEHTELVPDEIYQRPNYYNIEKLVHDHESKTLEHTNFVQRHIGFKENSFSKKVTSKYMKAGLNANSSDSDSDSDASQTKKRKSTHDSDDSMDDDDDYSLKNIKKPKNAYARRKATIIYSDQYSKIFTEIFKMRYNHASKITNNILRAAVIAILMTPVNRDQFNRMIDNNIHLPINILIWRLFIEHDMSSAIIMKGGLETGANLFGHSNFITGNDVVTKVIYGNFTFNSKAVVWKEKNVAIIENIRSMGYVGGNNTAFMTSSKDIDDQGKNRSSMIATALPITEDDFPKAMSFTGEHWIADLNESIDGKQKIHYTSARYYDSIYNISDRMNGYDLASQKFFDGADRMNIVAMQGLQFSYNQKTDLYDIVTECKGHRKRNGSGVGCADVWNGATKFFRQQDWSSYRFQ